MNIKNYTSSVAVATTISYIEAYLADCGVSGIQKEFKDGQPIALYFQTTEKGKTFTVKLPSQVDEVQEYLWREYATSRTRPQKTKDDFREQAARTAWRIQHDWVQVQMSLVKLKQADILQVFMAFVWDGEQTFYHRLKGTGFRQLAETTEARK